MFARMEKTEKALEEIMKRIDDLQIKDPEKESLVVSSKEAGEKTKSHSLSFFGHCLFEGSYASEFDQPSN